MNWFYESGGQQQGPVPEQELDRLLAEGKISANTLVWREGMADWQPLRTVRPTATSVPPAIPAIPGSDVPPGHVRCAATGRIIPESEAIWLHGKPYAPGAQPGSTSAPAMSQMPHAPAVISDLDRTGPPWERRGELGLVRAVGETISGVLLQPWATFASMRRTGGIGTPLMFYLLMGYICGTVAAIYGSYFSKFSQNQLSQLSQLRGPDGNPLTIAPVEPVQNFIYSVLSLLFLLPLASFVVAGIVHVCLLVFGGAKQGFETTYRVCCYVLGSVFVFWLLPGCGFLVLIIWGVVASIIGLAAAHETSAGRTSGAVLTPFIVCCGMVVLVYGAIIAAIVAAMQQAQ